MPILQELPRAWWPGVIKLSHSKTPARKGWNEDAKNDYEMAAAGRFEHEIREKNVEAWLEAGHPVGLVLPGGYICLDADSIEAVEWLEGAVEPGTPIQKRHAASAHFFFRYDAQAYPFKAWTQLCVGSSSSGAGAIIDLRVGGRSQTVIPPSNHDDGRPYRWIEPLPENLGDVPMMPEAIAEAVWDARPKKEHTRSIALDTSDQPGFDRVRSYIGRLCRYETTIEDVERKAREFAEEIYGDRPDRLAEHLSGDHPRLVAHMWDQWGAAAPLREMDNDRAIVELFMSSVQAGRWCYVSETRSFMRYERGIWKPRGIGLLRCEIGDFALSLMEDAHRETGNMERRERLTNLSMKLRQQPRIERVAKMVKDRIEVPAEVFETDPWIIPFPPGGVDEVGKVLDMRALEVRDLVPNDYVTRTMGVPYSTRADDSELIPFLEHTFPDPEVLDYVQKCAGLSMLGRVFEEHVFLFLYGRGKTGKSSFLNAMRAAFGDFGTESDFKTFIDVKGSGSNASPDVAKLRWRRLTICTEIPDGSRIGARMKTLTGEPTITARGLYEAEVSFRADFTCWVSGNIRPEANAIDSGVERRLKVIPANNQVDPVEMDTGLAVRLREQAPLAALIRWAGEGLEKVLESGGLGDEPQAIQAAARDYWKDQNPLDAFLEDRVVRERGSFTTTADLNEALDEWGFAEFGDSWPGVKTREARLTAKRIKELLEALGYRHGRDKKSRGYYGMRLLRGAERAHLREAASIHTPEG